MNCPNCGRELMEGEVCTCTQSEPVAEAAPVQEPQYQQPSYPNGYYNPQQYQQQPYYVPAPPAPVAARTDYPEGYKIKRKYVAIILAATLGFFGIHNFYLGNSSKATAQVLIATLGSLFFGLGMAVAYIWAIVEAVQLLTESIDKDANGFKIQTFEEALVAEKMKAEAKEND